VSPLDNAGSLRSMRALGLIFRLEPTPPPMPTWEHWKSLRTAHPKANRTYVPRTYIPCDPEKRVR
jgi:hypothetical protein